MPGGGSFSNVLHRFVLRTGVVLGDPDKYAGQHQADSAGIKQIASGDDVAIGQRQGFGKHALGDKVKRTQRQNPRHGQAFVQRRHDILHARRGLDEEATNDRGHDGHGAEGEWVHHRIGAAARDHQRAQHHGGDQRHGVGFK